MPVDANTIPSTRARAAQYAGYIVSYAMKIKQLLSGGWTPDILPFPLWPYGNTGKEGVEQVKFHINRELKQQLCWKYSTLCYSILKMASAGERRTRSTKYQDCWRWLLGWLLGWLRTRSRSKKTNCTTQKIVGEIEKSNEKKSSSSSWLVLRPLEKVTVFYWRKKEKIYLVMNLVI